MLTRSPPAEGDYSPETTTTLPLTEMTVNGKDARRLVRVAADLPLNPLFGLLQRPSLGGPHRLQPRCRAEDGGGVAGDCAVGNAFERLLVPPMVVTPGGSPAWCSFENRGERGRRAERKARSVPCHAAAVRREPGFPRLNASRALPTERRQAAGIRGVLHGAASKIFRMSSSIWGGTDFVHANALREAFTRKTTTRSCGSWW